MSLALAPGWTWHVERGPDWLFVRLCAPRRGDAEQVELADALWDCLQQHFTYRVVLELDDLNYLRSWLLGQLLLLQKRVSSHGGVLRIAGLSEGNEQSLRTSRLDQRLPPYPDRMSAVLGARPTQPR